MRLTASISQGYDQGLEIWAALADRTGAEGKHVNLRLHKWQPDERFYLYFRSATPILVSLYQLYPETGHPNSGETRLVLPAKKFPKSLQPVPAGEKVRMPILMKMDNTRADELMGICVQVLGASDSHPTNNPVLDEPPVESVADAPSSAGVTSGAEVVVQRQLNFAARAGRIGFQGKSYSIPSGARFSAVSEQSDPSQLSDLPIIAVNAHHIGFLKLTLHKD